MIPRPRCAPRALKGLCINLGRDRIAGEFEWLERAFGRDEAAWLRRHTLLMLDPAFEAGLRQIDAKSGPELREAG